MSKKVVIPLPATDFDPTEAAVTWSILDSHGIEVDFATPLGLPATGDPLMVTGKGLGPWKPFLQADKNGQIAYAKMVSSPKFMAPLRWSEINPELYDGIVLPGGHAPRMKEYLESSVLQDLIPYFFQNNKLVAAICHGVVLASRSKFQNGKSVLFGRKTTALLASQELLAWGLTCLWLNNYYRTYPETVQSEVTRALEDSNDFISGPLPLKRDSPINLNSGFVVQDKNYISARWPGDVHLFGTKIVEFFSP
jgi:protease I